MNLILKLSLQRFLNIFFNVFIKFKLSFNRKTLLFSWGINKKPFILNDKAVKPERQKFNLLFKIFLDLICKLDICLLVLLFESNKLFALIRIERNYLLNTCNIDRNHRSLIKWIIIRYKLMVDLRKPNI